MARQRGRQSEAGGCSAQHVGLWGWPAFSYRRTLLRTVPQFSLHDPMGDATSHRKACQIRLQAPAGETLAAMRRRSGRGAQEETLPHVSQQQRQRLKDALPTQMRYAAPRRVRLPAPAVSTNRTSQWWEIICRGTFSLRAIGCPAGFCPAEHQVQ